MRYRFMGKTGLLLSEFALGTNTFGGEGEFWKAFGALDQGQTNKVIGAAFDAGINLLDTADRYGDGESEVRAGQAIRDSSIGRDKVILATKVALRTGPDANNVGLSRAHILNAAEGSLRRLNTDYIDIYHLHNFDRKTALEETLSALDLLVRQGKVRYVGCSNFTAWQIAKARGIAMRDHLPLLSAAMVSYSVSERAAEREIIPFLLSDDIAMFAFGPLAAGLLTGKYTSDGQAPAGSRLSSGVPVSSANRPRALAAVEVMRPIAAEIGTTVGRIALAWLLRQPCVTSIVLGCKTVDQLHDNLLSADVVLTDQQLAALDAVCRPEPEYPFGQQASAAADRMPGGQGR